MIYPLIHLIVLIVLYVLYLRLVFTARDNLITYYGRLVALTKFTTVAILVMCYTLLVGFIIASRPFLFVTVGITYLSMGLCIGAYAYYQRRLRAELTKLSNSHSIT